MASPADTGLYDALTRNVVALDDTTDIVQSVQRFGTVGIVRAPVVDVSTAMTAANNAAGGDIGPLSELQIYADVAYASAPISSPSTCHLIRVFARQAFPAATPQAPLQLSFDASTAILLVYTSISAPDIPIQLTRQGKTDPVTLSFKPGTTSAIIKVIQDKDLVPSSPSALPLSSFNYMSVSDQILDNGEVQKLGLDKTNDHLPKLLTFQMLLAESLQQSQPDVSYKLASFVSAITTGIPKALDWNAQASTFLASQVIGDAAAPQRFVPDLDLTVAEHVLRSRLNAAEAFETAFQTFKAQGVQVQNTEILAHAALDSADDAARAYSYLAEQAKQTYDDAVTASDVAQRRFQDLQLTMPAKQKAFKDGLDAWEKKQIAKAVVEGVVALVAVVGSIAAAVVFPPAGAAVIAESGAVMPIIAVAADTAKELTTIAKILKQLKELFEIMKPGLEKISKVIDAIKDTLELLAKLKLTGKADDVMGAPAMPVGPGDDSINMSAQWDVFDVDMDAVFDGISSYDIEGASDFHTLLKEMSVLGKAVLAAQLAVSSAGSSYATALTQSLLSAQQAANLRKAVSQLKGNPYALAVFQRSMFDQLVNVRIWAFMDMSNYTSAYAWFSLQDDPPVGLDPMKPIATLMNDAATIQAKSAQAACMLRPQRRTFLLNSADAAGPLGVRGDADADGIAALKASRSATLSVLPRHAMFKPFMRVRVLSMLVVLQGAKPAPGSASVGLLLTRARPMTDLREPLPASATQDPDIPSDVSRVVAVVGASHRLGIEYVPDAQGQAAQRVLMSGALATGSYAAGDSSSLFSDWRMTAGDGVDLSQVTGVTVEAECEVSLL